MTSIVIALSCLALGAVVSADYPRIGYGGYGYGSHGIDYYAYPKYGYKYDVKDYHTGDVKSQEERRDGDHVHGYYSLVEPDGSIRVVNYRANDHSGFQAHVKKIEPNIHQQIGPIGGYGGYGRYGYGGWDGYRQGYGGWAGYRRGYGGWSSGEYGR